MLAPGICLAFAAAAALLVAMHAQRLLHAAGDSLYLQQRCRQCADNVGGWRGRGRWPHHHRPTATSTATSTDGNWCYEARALALRHQTQQLISCPTLQRQEGPCGTLIIGLTQVEAPGALDRAVAPPETGSSAIQQAQGGPAAAGSRMGVLPGAGEGLRAYYQSKIEELELAIRDKQHNLHRMEAQRNELNSRGGSDRGPARLLGGLKRAH